MKLTKSTQAILKTFSTINGGIVLEKGNFVMTRSVNGATYAEVTIPEEIDVNLAIYDLNGFLSILSYADEDSEISLDPVTNDIMIKTDKVTIGWPSADPTTIVVPKKAIVFPPASVEFDLSAEEFTKIMRVVRGLGADTLSITNTDGSVVINAFNKIVDVEMKKPLATFNIAEYNGSSDFNFVINILNMKMIPDDYTVKLWAKDSMFASKFEGKVVSYVLAVESDSTHNF